MNTIGKILRYVCGALVGIGVINFVIFIIFAAYLGGDALNGKQDGSHFYLGWKGTYTEVSSGIFFYSQMHVALLLINYALGLPAAYILYRLNRTQNA